MEKLNLRETQMATKELLQKFDTLCEKLGIHYFLYYGSLIGAIRHKGYIPWDDDLDVAMFLPDYKILERYFEDNDNCIEGMHLDNPKTSKDCFFNMTRVCDDKHILYFTGNKYTSGIFIDIYALEGMGNDTDLDYWDKWFIKVRKLRKNVYMSTNSSLLYGGNLLHKLLNIPLLIVSKIHGRQYYFNQLDKHKKFDLETSKYVGMPQWEDKYYPKECFEEIIKTKFEDITVNIPKNYDEFLRIEYGDYMKMPDEKKRVASHGFVAYRK